MYAYTASAPCCSERRRHQLTAPVIAGDYAKVSPNTNTTQYQRVLLDTQHPNIGIVQTLTHAYLCVTQYIVDTIDIMHTVGQSLTLKHKYHHSLNSGFIDRNPLQQSSPPFTTFQSVNAWLSGLIRFLHHSTCLALLADDLQWPGFKSRLGHEFSVGWTNGRYSMRLISRRGTEGPPVSSLNCDRCRLWSYDITAGYYYYYYY